MKEQDAKERLPGFDDKPCPFCGNNDSYLDEDVLGETLTVYFVCCPICEAEGPLGLTTDEALWSWNRRDDTHNRSPWRTP